MYSKVKRLRANGQRRSDRDIGSDPGVVGHVTIFTLENYQVASLSPAGDTGSRRKALPDLYRARCVTMHGDKMLLQGFETVDGGEPVKQEWAVQVMQEQPVDMAERSHRPT